MSVFCSRSTGRRFLSFFLSFAFLLYKIMSTVLWTTATDGVGGGELGCLAFRYRACQVQKIGKSMAFLSETRPLVTA